MGNYLALFDFDGTLTKKDSLADFIRYAVGVPRLIFGTVALSGILIRYACKLVDNNRAKQCVIQHFFAGWASNELNELGVIYAQDRLPAIMRPMGIQRLQWHLSNGHEVVIVSASPEIWIRPWAEKLKIKLIGTRLEERAGIITGNYCGLNCQGVEKVRRIKQNYRLEDFDKIYAYGDTPGDYPMLSLAHESFYTPFR